MQVYVKNIKNISKIESDINADIYRLQYFFCKICGADEAATRAFDYP